MASVMAALTTTTAATPTRSWTFEAWTPGRVCAKMTESRPSSTTFSRVADRPDALVGVPARLLGSRVWSSSGSGSAAKRHAWSAGIRRGRPQTQNAPHADEQRAPRSAGPTQGLSAKQSVKSSCATWIHYSCGSLMKIQMKAATPIHQRSSHRVVRHRERIAS